MLDFEEKNCSEGPNVGAKIYDKLLLYICSLCTLRSCLGDTCIGLANLPCIKQLKELQLKAGLFTCLLMSKLNHIF